MLVTGAKRPSRMNFNVSDFDVIGTMSSTDFGEDQDRAFADFLAFRQGDLDRLGLAWRQVDVGPVPVTDGDLRFHADRAGRHASRECAVAARATHRDALDVDARAGLRPDAVGRLGSIGKHAQGQGGQWRWLGCGQAISKRIERGREPRAPIGRKAPAPGAPSGGSRGVELAERVLLAVEPEEGHRTVGVERIAVWKDDVRVRVFGAGRPPVWLRDSRRGYDESDEQSNEYAVASHT